MKNYTIICSMTPFRYQYPIQIRYGDLDPQWHVNNARFATYLEQARFSYLMKLGLFDGHSFFDIGLIVADVHIAYLAPMTLTQKVRVGMGVTRIGNKSLTMEYVIEDEETGQMTARGETIMVAYDYHTNRSVPISDEWRRKISEYEGIPQREEA